MRPGLYCKHMFLKRWANEAKHPASPPAPARPLLCRLPLSAPLVPLSWKMTEEQDVECSRVAWLFHPCGVKLGVVSGEGATQPAGVCRRGTVL